MNNINRTAQKGTTMLFLLVFIVGLFLAIALATDSGNWLLNKTRLQNALDAVALSAAIALNGAITNNFNPDDAITEATAKGRETCSLFQQTQGNSGLSDINCNDSGELQFEFSKHLVDPATGTWNPTSRPARFVRVTSDALEVEPILIQILDAFSDPQPISAVSTAGAVGVNCNVTPFVMCATMPPYDPVLDPDSEYCLDASHKEEAYCQPVDHDCDNPYDDIPDSTPPDYECYGYTMGEITQLTQACTNSNPSCTDEDSLESGNWNLLDLEGNQGANDINEAIVAKEGVELTQCEVGNLNTKPGASWGPVKSGINDRYNSDTYLTEYLSGLWPVKDGSGTITQTAYEHYKATKLGNERRTMAVFFGDCRGNQNGNSDLPNVGNACVFLTEEAKQVGSSKTIFAEFAYSCPQSGSSSPLFSEILGPYKIVLFKSAGRKDS